MLHKYYTAFVMMHLASALRLLEPIQDLSHDAETAPRGEYVRGGSDIVWQRPKGEVKGIFLYLHGCGGYATDMFTKKGPIDRHVLNCAHNESNGAAKFNMTDRHHEAILMRHKVRRHGYLVASPQGGIGRELKDRCTNRADVKNILKSVEYLKSREDVRDKPIIVAGMSMANSVVSKISAELNASCSIFVEGFPSQMQHFSPATPVLFIHHPSGTNVKHLQDVKHHLEKRGAPTGEIQPTWKMKTKGEPTKGLGRAHFNYLGAYADEAIDFCQTGKLSLARSPEQKPLDLHEWEQEMGIPVYPFAEPFN